MDMRIAIAASVLAWASFHGVCLAHPAADERIRDLGSPVPSIRQQAATSLGRIGDREAVPALIQALRDADAGVRREAAKALGTIKDARAVPALLGVLRDGGMNVRLYAAYALGEIKDPRAAAALLQALRDPSWCVRDQAAWALREIRDPGTDAALEAAMKEPHADTAHIGWILRPAGTAGETVQAPRPDALAAWWSFDDQNPRVAKDGVGGTDGEIKGCTPVEGKVGHALQFGKGKYVELGKPAELSIAGTPFTVMAWVKTDARDGVVVARGGAFCGYSLYIKDGVAKFGIHRVEDGPAYIAAGRESVVGSWAHLAGVVKQDRIELYVNGKLAATAKTDGYIPGNSGQGMEIGFDVGNSPAEITDSFEGVIDEVKVYDAALSEDAIAMQCRPEK